MNFANILIKISTFFEEVRTEIRKVNWPTRSETFRYTLIVIALSVAVAIFLGGIDFLFTKLLDQFVL